MTGPTAIPHPETSSHHRNPSEPAVINTNLSSAPRTNRNSPPLVSPVYTRTAFSLPGPISPSSSFRNTANGWTATGVGSTSNGIKSPTAVHSTLAAQRDYFPESAPTTGGNTRHHRSTSASSTTSSIDSLGPTTPRSEAPPSMGGAPLGRVHSIPLGTSPYEHIKGRRNSIVGGQQLGAGWTGFGTLRGRTSDASERGGIPASTNGSTTAGSTTSNATGGMGGLFRKLSLSGTSPATGAHHQSRHRHDHRSASLSSDAGSTTSEGPNVPLAPNAPVSAPPTTGGTPALEAQPKMRGRQGSMSATKRKPSPHGERLLMGWTHAH